MATKTLEERFNLPPDSMNMRRYAYTKAYELLYTVMDGMGIDTTGEYVDVDPNDALELICNWMTVMDRVIDAGTGQWIADDDDPSMTIQYTLRKLGK